MINNFSRIIKAAGLIIWSNLETVLFLCGILSIVFGMFRYVSLLAGFIALGLALILISLMIDRANQEKR